MAPQQAAAEKVHLWRPRTGAACPAGKGPCMVVPVVGVLCVPPGRSLATRPLSSLGPRIFYVGAMLLASPEPAAGPRPVITWAHGTTVYAPACAPSNLSGPFDSGAR